MNKIVYILTIIVMLSSAAQAGNQGQNSIFDNLGLALGLYKQEITATEPGIKGLNDALEVRGAYDISSVKWQLDGVDVRQDSNIRHSVYRVSTVDLSKLKTEANQVHDKSGKDPATHRERHRITAIFDNEVRTWIVS